MQDSLPQDLPEFTGRAVELEQLRQGRDAKAVVISPIEGMAGAGKTQLAIHAAHLLLSENAFERVLFVNLRGYGPAQPLRLLGMPGGRSPTTCPGAPPPIVIGSRAAAPWCCSTTPPTRHRPIRSWPGRLDA